MPFFSSFIYCSKKGMSVSNGWTLPVITVNCGSSGGDTSALQAELETNNAFDTALASRVSNVETNLLQETKERKADVSSVFSSLQYEETARKSDVSSLTSRMKQRIQCKIPQSLH